MPGPGEAGALTAGGAALAARERACARGRGPRLRGGGGELSARDTDSRLWGADKP